MDIRIENKNFKTKGVLEFVEGELGEQPEFYMLINEGDSGESKIFFKAKDVKEFNDFVQDLKRVLRH